MPSKNTVTQQRILDLLLTSEDPVLLQGVYEELGKHLKKNQAEVRFTGTLDKKEQELLRELVLQKFPLASGVSFIEDDSLIGGIQVLYQDFIFDDSIKGKLLRLKGKIT